MGEQGMVGAGGSYGGIKSRFCGRKRTELQGAAGGLMCGSAKKKGKQMRAAAALGGMALIKRQRIDPCKT